MSCVYVHFEWKWSWEDQGYMLVHEVETTTILTTHTIQHIKWRAEGKEYHHLPDIFVWMNRKPLPFFSGISEPSLCIISPSAWIRKRETLSYWNWVWRQAWQFLSFFLALINCFILLSSSLSVVEFFFCLSKCVSLSHTSFSSSSVS